VKGEGIFARLPKRSPAAPLVQSRTPKKNFVFLLEEKIGGAQIKKCRENFFAGWRALASGGGAERQFRSKKVRAFSNKRTKKATPQQRLALRSSLNSNVLNELYNSRLYSLYHPRQRQ
jgi:hypothetical protein